MSSLGRLFWVQCSVPSGARCCYSLYPWKLPSKLLFSHALLSRKSLSKFCSNSKITPPKLILHPKLEETIFTRISRAVTTFITNNEFNQPALQYLLETLSFPRNIKEARLLINSCIPNVLRLFGKANNYFVESAALDHHSSKKTIEIFDFPPTPLFEQYHQTSKRATQFLDTLVDVSLKNNITEIEDVISEIYMTCYVLQQQWTEVEKRFAAIKTPTAAHYAAVFFSFSLNTSTSSLQVHKIKSYVDTMKRSNIQLEVKTFENVLKALFWRKVLYLDEVVRAYRLLLEVSTTSLGVYVAMLQVISKSYTTKRGFIDSLTNFFLKRIELEYGLPPNKAAWSAFVCYRRSRNIVAAKKLFVKLNDSKRRLSDRVVIAFLGVIAAANDIPLCLEMWRLYTNSLPHAPSIKSTASLVSYLARNTEGVGRFEDFVTLDYFEVAYKRTRDEEKKLLVQLTITLWRVYKTRLKKGIDKDASSIFRIAKIASDTDIISQIPPGPFRSLLKIVTTYGNEEDGMKMRKLLNTRGLAYVFDD